MPARFTVVRLPLVDSTQSEARRRLERGEAPDHLVLVADAQTAGRGRRGHAWHAAPGRSLLLTAVLPAPPLRRPERLLLLVAVAVARALEGAGGAPVAVKWPNDLYTGDRKLGGLLAERAAGPQGARVLLGLGLNLAEPHPPLPPGVAERAGHAGLPPGAATRERVLARLLAELAALLDALGTPREDAYGAAFQRRSWLDGREVDVHTGGRRFRARVRRVTADGDLELADGRRLIGAHVEHVSLPPGAR